MESFALAVSTPGNPLYHRYINPSQFAERFGATETALNAVAHELRSAGLHVGPAAANHLTLPVSGAATQFEQAFSIGFDQYRLPSGRFAYANTAAPAFPGDVAQYVQAVIGLDTTVQPQALGQGLISRSKVRTPSSGPEVITGGPQPCTTAQQDAISDDAYTADELASAYRFSTFYASGNEGAGETIALPELQPFLSSDISAYESCYGTNTAVNTQSFDGGAGTGAGDEATLDVEAVIGLAPKATIDVYEEPSSLPSLYDLYSKIISADKASVISISYGTCESNMPSGQIQAENTVFEEAAVQGQSVFAASGDTGSEGCFRSDGGTGLAVLDPASQPFVTAVGGTQMTAIGPPPSEVVWNDSSGASGGGISDTWTMPAYQADAPAGLNVINDYSSFAPCGTSFPLLCREVPDVSANAGGNPGYLIYWDGSWGDFWGTSAATPLWASLAALIDDTPRCQGTLGFANPSLYRVAATSYASNFNDITSGNNDWRGYSNGLYPAGPGYDMASGLGSPNAVGLAADLCPLAGPDNLGDGPLGSGPTVVVNKQTGADFVYWEGTDGNLWEAYWNVPTNSWVGPVDRGFGPLGSPPSAVINSNGTAYVYWRGSGPNHDLIMAQGNPSGPLAGPDNLGDGPLGSGPAAAVNMQTGADFVYWEGTDGNLWEAYWNVPTNSWVGPVDRGFGPLGSPPSAVIGSNGAVYVFWRGADGNLWQAQGDPSKSLTGPFSRGMGPLGSAPAATIDSADATYVYWEGTDGNLWEAYWNGARWVGPVSKGLGPLGSAPNVVINSSGTAYVYWRGSSAQHNLSMAFGNPV